MPDRKKDEDKGTNIEVYLEDVRISYPHLWRPTTFKNDEKAKPKYQASFIVDPKTQKDLHNRILDAIEDVQVAKWDDPEYCRSDKLPYVNGNSIRKREEYQGMWVLSAKSDRRPQVVDAKKAPLTEEDGVIYAGCYVDAIVRIYALDNQWGDRVNASLEIVRYRRRGEAFGAEPADVDAMPESTAKDEDGGRGSRSRGRGRDEEGRGDRDRGSRGAGDRDARGSRDRDDGERGARSGRDRDDDRPRGRDRGSDDADSRERDRGNDRGRDRDRASDRGRDRDRDDAPRERERSRGRDRDDDAPPRGRDRDEGRSRGRARDDNDDVV